ncbi:hypothetical protein MHBO_000595 [Bonamia ostreae]|uniref:AAA+ ATPase domain-containing protein n=1 Tax=Bonamia ostreae TaxID=126728 RepID=A0ABV2AG72_9EUKA
MLSFFKNGSVSADKEKKPDVDFTHFDPKNVDTTKLTGFDPAFLERGVDALKKIESSPNSKKVLRLLFEQEKTNQMKMQNRILDHQLRKKRDELKEKANYQREVRKSNAHKAELEKELAEKKSELEEERVAKLLKQKQSANEQWMAQQRNHFKEQQEMQRKTDRLRIQQEESLFKKRALHEIDLACAREKSRSQEKAKRERENADLYKSQLIEKSRLKREEMLEVITKKYQLLSLYTDRLFENLSEPRKLNSLILGTSAIFSSFFASKYGLNLLKRYLETRIGKPSLVRETSRRNIREPFRRFNFKNGRKWFYTNAQKFGFFTTRGNFNETKTIFNGIFLNKDVRDRLEWLSRVTLNTNRNNAPFQNILLYGEPGTGKTLFSKSLAINSGMHYAILTGGDFSQLGKSAVTELHKIFDWAERSKRGTLLFIDEADSILRKGRDTSSKMSENMRNVLSAFLYRTGTPSNKFMLVLATNLPAVLDDAILDRIDESIHFPFPALKERTQIFLHNIKKGLSPNVKNKFTLLKTLKGGEKEITEMCKRLAAKSEGFSGRTIQKTVVALQHSLNNGRFGKDKISTEEAEKLMTKFIESCKINFKTSHI